MEAARVVGEHKRLKTLRLGGDNFARRNTPAQRSEKVLLKDIDTDHKGRRPKPTPTVLSAV